MNLWETEECKVVFKKLQDVLLDKPIFLNSLGTTRTVHLEFDRKDESVVEKAMECLELIPDIRYYTG